MAGQLPTDTNINLESPTEFEFAKKKFWIATDNIENKDLLDIYTRQGIATRTVNKENELMFKNGWTTEQKGIKDISNENSFDKIAQFAHLNASVSGWCLVYANYGDSFDYSQPPPHNAIAIDYYVLPRAWVYRDVYYNQKVYDTYEIYRATGQTFEVHKDRFIRVRCNPEEISKFLPAINSLQVLENVLWGMGQTMFRSGSGFPVLKINKSGSIVKSPNGTNKTRMQSYKDAGIMRDMNTQVGFMIDMEDDFQFQGAEGKAISPGEYYDRAFQQVAVDLEVPVDILKGISAGAITGSETNMKIYFGDLHSKQNKQLQPIYDDLFLTKGIIIQEPFIWNPIFELTQTEILNNLKSDVESIYKLELYNYYSHEQAVNYFADKYPILQFNEKNIKSVVNLPKYEKQQGFSFSNSTDGKTIKISKDETSTLPKKVQTGENKYRSEMTQAFKQTAKSVGDILADLNK